MDHYCKYCNNKFKSVRSLYNHENICESNPNLNFDIIISKQEENLIGHYYFLYQDDFIKLRDDYIIKYKNQGYSRRNANILAKKDALKDIIEKDEKIQIDDGTWECPICGLHIKDMGAHIKNVHNIRWDDFTALYNWDGPKVYFSKSYRQNLSKNKKHFYNETEKGALAKKELSEKYSGDKNPACRDEVRLKISKSRLGQYMSIKNKQNISKSTTSGLYSDDARSYGYTFWTLAGDREIMFRSKCEYLIYIMFNYYHMDVKHEPYKIEYFDPDAEFTRHYIVDYVYKNRLFEVKPKISDFTKDIKYNLVQNQLSKVNKKLEVLTPSNFLEVFNIGDDLAKPLSFFEDILIDNIRGGICKLMFPIAHNQDFYKNSSFVKKIGGLDAINNGELLYENKKSCRNK